MKPAPVEYTAPDTLEEVLSILAEHGSDAKLLAGGQSLVPMMSFRLAAPQLLIDLNRVHELSYVRSGSAGGVEIGGMTRQRTLERDAEIRRTAPLLAEIAPYIAHPQIRNRGTIGGSLAHADPAAELPVATVVLGAHLLLRSADGERRVDAGDFFTSLLTTCLREDEIVAAIEFDAQPARTGDAFLELARRHGDYAHAGVAARVTVDESGRCTAARLVYLSVGDVPMVASRAAELLVAEGIDDGTVRAAAEIATRDEIDPTGDIHASAEYKRHIARVLTERALHEAHRRAAGGSR